MASTPLLRALLAAAAVSLAAARLPAQAAPQHTAAFHPTASRAIPASMPDARLFVIQPAPAAIGSRPGRSAAWQDVTRPRWRYPAIGAAVGLAGGMVHAYRITRGDYMGWPVEPMYVLPPAYGALGAFLGLLVDSSERERKASRNTTR